MTTAEQSLIIAMASILDDLLRRNPGNADLIQELAAGVAGVNDERRARNERHTASELGLG